MGYVTKFIPKLMHVGNPIFKEPSKQFDVETKSLYFATERRIFPFSIEILFSIIFVITHLSK